MRTRALWRFDEAKNEQRPIDAIGAVAELNHSPIEFTADSLRRATGLSGWKAGWHCNESAGDLAPAFGGPTLTRVGAGHLYGLPGVRSSDRAVQVPTLFDAWTGGDVYDITAADDFLLALIVRWTSVPLNARSVISKVSAAFAEGWAFAANSINLIFQVRQTAGSFINSGIALSSIELNSYYAALVSIERANPSLRLGLQNLATGAVLFGNNANIAALDFSTSASLNIGGNPWNAAETGAQLAGAYLGLGPGIATGMQNINNFAAALSGFASAVLSTSTVVDAAAGRGRSFFALSGQGFEAADVDSGATLLTRDASVQALVRWDLGEHGASTLWTLTKTGGSGAAYDAGASSVETLAGDGYVEITVANLATARYFGLSDVDVDATNTTIDYAIRYDVTDYSVVENGVQKLTISGVVAGDVLRIERIAGTVYYKRNGVTYYTSLVPSAGPLRIDTSFLNAGTTLEGIRLVDAGVPKAITWQNLVHVTATPTENIAGTLYARGKATGAAEYLNAGVELRVVNAAQNVGEIRWLWQDTAGVLKRQVGGHFAPPTDGSYIMLTATRRWVGSNKVILRYFLGDQMLAEVESVDGSIGGGTTGTTTIGARFDGTKWTDFFDGVIDELRVVDYELAPDEIAATWARITKYQPRGYELLKQMHPPGFPISGDPSSRVQRETNMWGQALGYAAAQGENLRNILPDTAYGDALARWEGIVGVSPKALDDLDTRRERVLGRLRQRAGVSIPGVQEALKGLIGTAPENLEIFAFSQEVVEQYDRPAVWSTGEGARIVKTGASGAFDAGASSVQTIAADGYLEFVAAGSDVVLGLSDADSNADHSDILFGWHLSIGPLAFVRESGVVVHNAGAYADGDIFRIERKGTTIRYYRNGALVYTSAVASSGALRVDSSLYTNGGTLRDIRLYTVEDTEHREVGLDWQNVTLATVTPARWVPNGDTTRVQGANGEDLEFTGVGKQQWRTAIQSISSGEHFKTQVSDPLKANVAEGWGAHLLTKIDPIALPNRAELGIAFWDRARNTAFLFGLRNDAGTYRIITERIVDGVSLGVINRAVTALAAHWLHLFSEAPSPVIGGAISDTTWNLTAAWSTTNATSGYTSYAGIAHAARFQWAALYLRSFGGTLSAAADAYFDDTRLFTPYGDRSLYFYVYRNLALAGSVDILGARDVISALKHAHTRGSVITTKTLICGDAANSPCGHGPVGVF